MFRLPPDADERDVSIHAQFEASADETQGEPIMMNHDRVMSLVGAQLVVRAGHKRTQRSRILMAGASAAVLALAAFVGPRFLTPAASVRTVEVSWPYAYRSLAEVADASDLVAVGTVVGRHDAPLGNTAGGLPETRFDLSVVRTLRGTAPVQLVVTQSGGTDSLGIVEVADDPLMIVGSDYLLFMRWVPDRGVFAIVGGPQGRLVVEGSRVSSLPGGIVLGTTATIDSIAAELGR